MTNSSSFAYLTNTITSATPAAGPARVWMRDPGTKQLEHVSTLTSSLVLLLPFSCPFYTHPLGDISLLFSLPPADKSYTKS